MFGFQRNQTKLLQNGPLLKNTRNLEGGVIWKHFLLVTNVTVSGIPSWQPFSSSAIELEQPAGV